MKKSIILLIVVTLFSCSSQDVKHIKSQEKIQKLLSKQDFKKKKETNSKNKKIISNIPKWFLNPPTSNNKNIYAVGLGIDENLEVSLKKAILNAELNLSKNIDYNFNSEIQYEYDLSGQKNIKETAKANSSSFIAGYKRAKQKLITENGKIKSYVLLVLNR